MFCPDKNYSQPTLPLILGGKILNIKIALKNRPSLPREENGEGGEWGKEVELEKSEKNTI